MFGGSGLGDVQNSNSEHLRGTKHHKIHRMEAKGGKKGGWRAGGKPVGWRERRGGGILISSEDCRILQMRIEDLQPGFDTPRAPMGAADLWAAAAAADPSWDGMRVERENRGRLCEHIA